MTYTNDEGNIKITCGGCGCSGCAVVILLGVGVWILWMIAKNLGAI